MTSFWNTLPRPFFALAPMEAVTDTVFRHVIARAAPPDIYFTEFTNATGWVHAGDKAIGGRLHKTADEKPIVAQIWGGNAESMGALANHCKTLGFDGIDINMGCPAKTAIKSGGAALIKDPELAAQAIAAAKTCGLPISVKTRLGYTKLEEWRPWLTHVLQQDIVNLTIHLRTKKEMSKVPAHHELIGDIKALRDKIAPQTLLTINGDVADRQHGLELVKQMGVDGVMIGRGVFANLYCFEKTPAVGDARRGSSQESLQSKILKGGPNGRTHGELQSKHTKKELIDLLLIHLDFFDEQDKVLPRKFDPLKRFFKIYIRDFDGAAELRDTLMHTKSTTEVRMLINESVTLK